MISGLKCTDYLLQFKASVSEFRVWKHCILSFAAHPVLGVSLNLFTRSGGQTEGHCDPLKHFCSRMPHLNCGNLSHCVTDR